ncbi:hypothetical protein [Streptomyces sp. Isolate_45]|uniref:hypothetical protein n=1 Tax=Streptomyces sp. Isolate_45 TaxID=2950111 RepID=UPI002481F4C5|nr:hypothetical protein [Streptomyces sp. Isolate_45]MDA5284630.1 hypothetical protein [Streptomyces sp. Isolate_45]
MTALVPAGRLPANTEGPANSYTGLADKLRGLQAAAEALQEHAKLLQDRMRRNGRSASALMDLCAAAGVATNHTGRIADISKAFGDVATGGARIASVTDAMGTAAGNVAAQHRTEYGGINAASTSSPVIQAKPGFYRVD